LFTAPALHEYSIFKASPSEINTHANFFHSGIVLAFIEASGKRLISFNVVVTAAIPLLPLLQKKKSREVE